MRPNPDLDRIDRALLALLLEDARRTNKELAARVGLAPSTCHARVQRLVSEGVVRGFHADVDLAQLGLVLEAMISVQLVQQTAAIDELTARLAARPEVLQVYHVSGSEDLLVHVAVQDTEHLAAILKEGLFATDEVRHVETSVIFEHATSTVLAIDD
jgi:DNA-binding Lrp family transcriptional regulator